MTAVRGALRVAVAVVIGLIVLVGVSLARRASDGSPARVAVLRTVAVDDQFNELQSFKRELAVHGYRHGRNLELVEAVEPDPTGAELRARRWERGDVDLIMALSADAARAAIRGAPKTEVLFLSNDPEELGLVASERRPVGRATGTTSHVPGDRTLDLARRAAPGLEPMGLLASNDEMAAPVRDALVESADALDIPLSVQGYSGPEEVGKAIAQLRRDGARLLILVNSPGMVAAEEEIRRHALEARLPVVANSAVDFAMLVLEPDRQELFGQLGRQAAQLLDGIEAGEVPVEDPARFRVTVNLDVAEQMGVPVSSAVVDDADEVVTSPHDEW